MMKQNIKRHVSLFWTTFTLTFLGGLAGIWWFSERLSEGVNFVVVMNSSGTALNGNYKLNIWIIFLLLSVIMAILMASFALYREFMTIKSELDEISLVNMKYEDALRRVRNVAEKLNYTSDNLRRISIQALHARHYIHPDASTYITHNYKIMANKTANFLNSAIEGDEESDPIYGYTDLDLQIVDKDQNKELDWVPLKDNPRAKQIYIFFPDLQRGETKNIEVKYKWKGFMRRVLDMGSTEFWWFHAATTPSEADVIFEWIYKTGFPHVTTKLIGNHGPTAELSSSHTLDGVCWKYHDPKYRIDDLNRRVTVQLT